MRHHQIYMQTFRKAERLCHHSTIRKLFSEGSSFYIYPIKVIWLPVNRESGTHARILISVSKRNFKNAVQRNRVKRLIREAYRKNKGMLYQYLDETGKHCVFALVYTANKIVSLQKLESIIILILQRLIKEYEKDTG